MYASLGASSAYRSRRHEEHVQRGGRSEGVCWYDELREGAASGVVGRGKGGLVWILAR